MTERPAYVVRALPEGKFWVLHIHGLPPKMFRTTQALQEKGDADIEAMARDFIALSLEVDEQSFDLKIVKENEEEKNDEPEH